jgi:hypothetical protein
MLSLEDLARDKTPLVSRVDIVTEDGSWKVPAAVEQWTPREATD